MFAKYVGAAGGVPLTKGRIYLVRPAVEDHSAVDYDVLVLTDDNGKTFSFGTGAAPGAPMFEFLDYVYAVATRDMPGARAGEAVVVVGATDDGYFDVKGKGNRKADCFEVLDESNVAPGFFVLDLATWKWQRITLVASTGWISIGADLRPPTDFVFPVSAEGLMGDPMVRCVNADGDPLLKKGEAYRMVTWDRDKGFIGVEIDGGVEDFFESRFEMGG
jgi:hypothetical protein